MRDGWFWRSLYGGSEVGWKWRVGGGMTSEGEKDANAIFIINIKCGIPQIQFHSKMKKMSSPEHAKPDPYP